MRTVTDAEIQRGCCDEPDRLFEVGVDDTDGVETTLYSTYDEDVANTYAARMRRELKEKLLSDNITEVWFRVDGEDE